ncbi:transcriptional regulator [Shewanella sairae]|uniref:Transcriptional regulator n=1 Tax=Shewanella sairae TaxID=190310 RepID=A0ABQ4NSL8_9GAMM|nr:HU family DNA-binding protein [Shewanella sairae]GIU02197.1 transcriptional regulator [Shewanella sairae]
MTKTELVAKMIEKSELSKKEVEAALNALIGTITETLKADEEITLVGFGTFKVSKRAERVGRNPRTGEPLTIAAANVPSFKAGKTLKDAVNA